MSELNLTHSNGNKVKLTTPDTLAASKTFKLPGIDGSSRDILTTNGSGALSFSKPGLTLIETKQVDSGSGSATAFHFNNCFIRNFVSTLIELIISKLLLKIKCELDFVNNINSFPKYRL